MAVQYYKSRVDINKRTKPFTSTLKAQYRNNYQVCNYPNTMVVPENTIVAQVAEKSQTIFTYILKRQLNFANE